MLFLPSGGSAPLNWGGCPSVIPVEESDGFLATVGQWLFGVYVSHPVATPLIAGVAAASVLFLSRFLILKLLCSLWTGVVKGVQAVTWPVRKVYTFLFTSRKARGMQGVVVRSRGVLPIIGQRAYFGPDREVGLKERRLGVVLAMYGGMIRGQCLRTGEHIVCSPDAVEAA